MSNCKLCIQDHVEARQRALERPVNRRGGGPGQLAAKLKDRLVAIQRGEAPDPYGWVQKIA